MPIPCTNGYGAALRLLLGRAGADHGKVRTVNRWHVMTLTCDDADHILAAAR
jgi:hypothetical protein